MSENRPKRVKLPALRFRHSWLRTDLRSGAGLQLQRSIQLVEQSLRLLQIGRVEPLGEPAVVQFNTVQGYHSVEYDAAFIRIRAINVAFSSKADEGDSEPNRRIEPGTELRSGSILQPQRSRQFFEQRLRFLRIGGVESSEPSSE